MVQFKQPLTSTTSATDTVAMLCTVQNIDLTNLIASVMDQTGTARKVSLKVLPGKPTDYPAAGERWVISREYGDWMFVASVNTTPAFSGLTDPTSSPTPLSLVSRDSNGRSQFADPSAAQDASTKHYTDAGDAALATTIANNLLIAAPPGGIMMYGGASAPTGWLLCDGSSVLRATYPSLFTAIGTTYGSVDGTHFTLPNMSDLFPIGKSGTNALGSTGGAATHTHPLSSNAWAQMNPFTGAYGANLKTTGVAAWNENTRTSGTAGTPATGITRGVPLGGATDSGSTLPPYLALNFIIKT